MSYKHTTVGSNPARPTKRRKTITDKPILSTTEEKTFKQCRLAHHFGYTLGYSKAVAGRKLRLGIGVHKGLETLYRGGDVEDALAEMEKEFNEQYHSIIENPLLRDYGEALGFFEIDTEMAYAMVEGYPEWAEETGIDKGWETIGVEEAALIEIPGAYHDLPVRFDLAQRNMRTGEIRIRDFKTAKIIPHDFTGYQLSEQNGNYSLAALAMYGELPREFSYVFLKKVVPSARTKPPYYHEKIIVRSELELEFRVEEFKRVSKEIHDGYQIISAPDNCCGSWKNDWASPCMLVHAGIDPEEALELTPGYVKKHANERYNTLMGTTTENDE